MSWRALALLAAVAVVSGCGGDKEPSDTAAKPPAKTDTSTTDRTGAKPAPAPRTDTAAPKPSTSPEVTQKGGAGDEEPARSQALLTGRGGRIAPPVVRVPPYISIRIELRSADGQTYELRFGRRRIRAGGQVSSASASFPGLRPGKVLVGRPVGKGKTVRIEANAEPGP
jgi:hypothetical protein